jgi:hypothetical protein
MLDVEISSCVMKKIRTIYIDTQTESVTSLVIFETVETGRKKNRMVQ